jgi:Cytochrome c554 and c-prime
MTARRRLLWLFPLFLLGLLAFWLVARSFVPSDRSLSGVVTMNGQPVAGARVRVQTTDPFAVTDNHGRFHLVESANSKGKRLTAWKDGFFIAGTAVNASPLALSLAPLPEHDSPDYEWVDPAPQRGGLHNCAHCHSEMYREWTDSAHSRSASGRHFRNLYEGTDWNGEHEKRWSLLDQRPDGAAVCSSCHAPAIPTGDPALFDLREVKGVAAKGVHCDYCHKIADVGDGNLGLTHGRFNLNLLRPEKAKDGEEQRQIFFGPLDDVDRGEDAFSPLYKQSRYCASCHEGVVFGVPVYTTYSEWLASPAKKKGTQCQDCHMKPTGEMTNFALGAGGHERAAKTLSNHRFVDGSLKDMLQRSVRTTAKLEAGNDTVRVTVSVTAEGVGHRVPTGFVDRHLLLVVEGLTARGETCLPREGPRLPDFAGETFAGKGGVVYAKLLKNEEGRSPAPFWSADVTPRDNRLWPEEPDQTAFVFPSFVDRVRVRVIYRRFWAETVRLKQWPNADAVIVDQVYQR